LRACEIIRSEFQQRLLGNRSSFVASSVYREQVERPPATRKYRRTTGATVASLIPLVRQYDELSHVKSVFMPLLPLQARQHSAMLS
jgi:hypothetical protein